MDDIYDWSSKFGERLDDLEEVKFSSNSFVKVPMKLKTFLPFSVGCHVYFLKWPKVNRNVKEGKVKVFAA